MGGCMRMLRTLAVAQAGAALLAALSASPVQACDNDRYPCPVVAQTQNTGEAAAKSSAQSRRETTHAARQAKARVKSEAQALPSVSKDAANGQRQAAASSRRTAANSASNLNEQIDRKESQVSAAAAAWLVGATAGDTAPQSAVGDDATAVVPVSTVQLVDPREPNELDLAADSQAPAQSGWLSSLLATLGAALAAASAMRFLFV
jgi:hypothetical protein